MRADHDRMSFAMGNLEIAYSDQRYEMNKYARFENILNKLKIMMDIYANSGIITGVRDSGLHTWQYG